MNSDFRDLLRLLAEKEVKFLVIGGYAVIHYAEPRYTKDLDLLIGIDSENAKKVFDALLEFGAPMETVTPLDFCIPEGLRHATDPRSNTVSCAGSIKRKCLFHEGPALDACRPVYLHGRLRPHRRNP